MKQKKAEKKPVVVAKQTVAVPANLSPGLIPVYLWWKESGRSFMANVAVVLLVFGVVFGGNEWRKGRIANANKAFRQADSLGELEDFVAKYGSMKIGNAARLRLAKAYFDAARYTEALDTYTTCISKGAPEGFAEIAQLGLAHALEAEGRLNEAFDVYRQFAETTPGHFLAAQTQMGMARVLTLQGEKDEAKHLLEILKAEKTDDPMVTSAVAQLEGVISRYEPRAARSLFDLADEAARELELAVPVAPATGTDETP